MGMDRQLCSDGCCAQVLPRMTAVMAGAAPFSNPAQGVREAQQWRPLLESAQSREAIFAEVASSSSDAYASMLNATVVPVIASAVTNQWEPRDPEPLLTWIDAWKDALPAGVQMSILETLIFPKASTNCHLRPQQKDASAVPEPTR